MLINEKITGTWREEDSGLITNPVITSTIAVTLLDAGADEEENVKEALYDMAGRYVDDIRLFMSKFCPLEYPSQNLMEYFTLPGLAAVEASIRGKVKLAIPSVYADGEKLYGVMRLTMTADLTNGELELFKQQIEKQYADGWGGLLEETDIPTACGDMICVRLWQDDMEFYPGQKFQTTSD